MQVPVAELPNLFKPIGTLYGGDGNTTFAFERGGAGLRRRDALSLCISLFGDVPAGG